MEETSGVGSEESASSSTAAALTMSATAVGLTAAAAAVGYLTTRAGSRAVHCPVQLEEQSRRLPGGVRGSRLPLPESCTTIAADCGSAEASATAGAGHCSDDSGEGGGQRLLLRLYADCATVHHFLQRGERVSDNGPCLGWRPADDPTGGYRWINYGRVSQRAADFGAGLVAMGLSPGQETMVGIYARNRVEWVLAEQACYCYSMVSVALYDTLGVQACHYIVDHSRIACVVVDSDQRAQLLLQRPASCLRYIVHMNGVSETTSQLAAALEVQLLPFEMVEVMGAGKQQQQQPSLPEHVATISYTSGTTGEPKGVVLTHAAIVANVSAVLLQMGGQQTLAPGDTMLSYLPLSHTLERMCQFAMLMQGGAVGFWRGDIRLLMDDLQTLRPTAIPAVPRIFNRIYDRVQQMAAASRWKSLLLQCAMWAKRHQLAAGRVGSSGLWDRLVFSAVRRSLGGRVRFVVLGSAPIAPPVLTFVRAALGCVVLEGYGQTECVCPCTITLPGDHQPAHVGAPLACSLVRLVDVPDMDYWAAEDRGEVCVRGTALFSGYYRDAERTAEVLDADGWLHTGDIGEWLPNGTLRIIDRKKNIFKLAQGEYVAPERVEAVLSRAPLVGQVYVHGDSVQSCLVAVVVPDAEPLRQWALSHGHWEDTSPAQLCAIDQLRDTVLQQLQLHSQRAGLKGFERVRAVHLHPEPLSVDNGLLTATMKVRRHAVAQRFRPQIDEMYATLQ